MKIIYPIILCLLSISLNAQNGIIKKDTLFLNNGRYYIKNKTIDINKGSKADGGYAHISTRPYKFMGKVIMPVPLTAGWDGYKMKIINFELIGNEIMGKKYHLVLTIDKKNKSKYLCDPVLALKNGEID